MASLKDIRRRIGSVKNTQQITRAMKMVAAAKLRRAQQAISGARPFAEKLEEITGRLLAEIGSSVSSSDPAVKIAALKKLHPLLKDESAIQEGSTKNVGLVVVSSDRGLCGAYNSSILRFANNRKKELESEVGVQVHLYYIGRRANEFFTKRALKGQYFKDVWAGKFTTQKSDELAKFFVNEFLQGKLDRVEVCYTEFKSAILQVPKAKVLLPLSLDVNVHDDNLTERTNAPLAEGDKVGFIYKPGRQELLEKLLPKQVQTQFYKLLADSLASEHGARMTSMDNATRNAADMIARLTLAANRVRQASITTELMEIIGGAEALKG